MVGDGVKRFTVRDLPHHRALVQIERGDAAPWWLHERQPLNGETATGVSTACAVDPVHVGSLLALSQRNQTRQRVGEDVQHSGIRIVRPARPIGAVRHVEHSGFAAFTFHDWRRKQRTELELRSHLQSFGFDLRREVDQIFFLNALQLERRRLGWEWLRRAGFLARYRGLFDGAFFDWPDRFAGLTIEDVQKSLFRRLRDRLDRPAVDGDVHQYRRAGDVVVPDAVMNELIMPDALTGRELHCEQRFGKQVVAGPMTAVVVAGGQFDREVDETELLVD